jgi:hypothetical protein
MYARMRDIYVCVFNKYTLGYNDFDFFDKMKPPRPEIDLK